MLKQQKEHIDAALKQREQQFLEWLESQYLNVDTFKAQNQAAESAAEENRLATEAQASVIEASKPPAPKESAAPAAVIINNNTPPAPSIPPILPIL